VDATLLRRAAQTMRDRPDVALISLGPSSLQHASSSSSSSPAAAAEPVSSHGPWMVRRRAFLEVGQLGAAESCPQAAHTHAFVRGEHPDCLMARSMQSLARRFAPCISLHVESWGAKAQADWAQ
jgi:hypothetical protein